VDAYPNGASPFGLLNTAGNVWEWRRDGYAIGGGFRSRGLSSPVPGAGWTADFLRDGKPGEGVYGNPKFDQRKYSKYRVSDTNLQEVGIRCVIEL
jgi:formylglycine-generating enzyme required for sulfatase activity